MEIIELIFKLALFAINSACVCFICIAVSKWHRHMENKLNEIKEYTRRVSDRNDVVYINQLNWLKSELIKEERYEEADKINKCIEDEFNKLKNGPDEKNIIKR